MSQPREPLPSKLVLSAIYSGSADREEVEDALRVRFGRVEMRSEAFKFDRTEYYVSEMGKGLERIFYVHEGLVEREYLIEAKLIGYDMEISFSRSGRRLVNIDPAILNLENLILATFKNYCHRIYLGRGVYGEVTLYYRNREFRDLPWTYPDFRDIKYKEFFNRVRDSLYCDTVGRGGRDDN